MVQFTNNANFCWINSALTSFIWALHNITGLPNQDLPLPTPSQGLEAALLSWSNLDLPYVVSANAFIEVYLEFLGGDPVERRNRAVQESPETFFRDIGPGWTHDALPLATATCLPRLRTFTLGQNCNCPEDGPAFANEQQHPEPLIDIQFPHQGFQAEIDLKFRRHELGRCPQCDVACRLEINSAFSTPSQIVVVAVNRINFISRNRPEIIRDEIEVPEIVRFPTLQGPKNYTLISAIQHRGGLNPGEFRHFVSYLKFQNGFALVDDAKEIKLFGPNVIKSCHVFVFVETDDDMQYA